MPNDDIIVFQALLDTQRVLDSQNSCALEGRTSRRSITSILNQGWFQNIDFFAAQALV